MVYFIESAAPDPQEIEVGFLCLVEKGIQFLIGNPGIDRICGNPVTSFGKNRRIVNDQCKFAVSFVDLGKIKCYGPDAESKDRPFFLLMIGYGVYAYVV